MRKSENFSGLLLLTLQLFYCAVLPFNLLPKIIIIIIKMRKVFKVLGKEIIKGKFLTLGKNMRY